MKNGIWLSERGWEIAGIGLALLCFAYNGVRAWLAPITHDEAVSFIYYVRTLRSWTEIWLYLPPLPIDANNHLLNTLAMREMFRLFGPQEWALRLFALAGFAAYLAGIFFTLRLFLKKAFLFLGLYVCFFHPFLLFIFLQARGYSWALGLTAWGLYGTFRWIRALKEDHPDEIIWLHYAAGCFTLAAVCHLTFLNVLVPAVFLFFLFHFEKYGRKGWIRRFFLPVVPWLFLLAAVDAFPVLKLKEVGQLSTHLATGGFTGFWQDTVTSLVTATCCVYDRCIPFYGPARVILKSVIALFPIMTLAVLIRPQSKPLSLTGKSLLWITALLVWMALWIIFEHFAGGALYPMNRTAIYFIPVFMTALLLAWAYWAEKVSAFTKILRVFLLCFLIGLGAVFSYRLPSDQFIREKDLRETVRLLIEWKENGVMPLRWVRIATRWENAPILNFYIHKKGAFWMMPVYRDMRFDRLDPQSNFYLLTTKDMDFIRQHQLTVIRFFPESQFILAVAQNQRNK